MAGAGRRSEGGPGIPARSAGAGDTYSIDSSEQTSTSNQGSFSCGNGEVISMEASSGQLVGNFTSLSICPSEEGKVAFSPPFEFRAGTTSHDAAGSRGSPQREGGHVFGIGRRRGGLYKSFTGKARSFQSLSDCSNLPVEELSKEHLRSKRRRRSITEEDLDPWEVSLYKAQKCFKKPALGALGLSAEASWKARFTPTFDRILSGDVVDVSSDGYSGGSSPGSSSPRSVTGASAVDGIRIPAGMMSRQTSAKEGGSTARGSSVESGGTQEFLESAGMGGAHEPEASSRDPFGRVGAFFWGTTATSAC